jgi:hypothetical protein
MSRLKMLFIDDDENSVRSAMKWADSSFQCACVSFRNIESALDNHQPHIAIVDRMEGIPPNGTDQGSPTFDVIWNHRFCPVIIYSAFPEEDDDSRKAHPFVRRVKKAADLQEFKTAVECLASHAKVLQDAEQHIRQQFAVAMREVAPYASSVCTDPTEYNNAVTRHGRRRMAALMDELTLGALSIWEQYIYPPIGTDIKLGDILKLTNGSPDDPSAFRIVLTPSCDMVAGQSGRTETILVACCVPNATGLKAAGLPAAKAAKIIDSHFLSTGHRDGILPLPPLKGRIPSMMADLKKLELLPRSDIGETKPYERVASIDSPFRELVAWAYLSVACRPGVPNRDLEPWAAEIAPGKLQKGS